MSRILIFTTIALIAFESLAIAQDKILQLHSLHQEKNLCVPTSAAMVLKFYGKYHSPRELKVWSRGKEYNSQEPFNDFTATLFDSLLIGLKNHGIYWSKLVFPNDPAGFRVGVLELKNQIDKGHPVLIDTSNLYSDGHTLVVSGYREGGAIFTAMDPMLPLPGFRDIPLKTLERVWNSTAVNANDCAAIITD